MAFSGLTVEELRPSSSAARESSARERARFRGARVSSRGEVTLRRLGAGGILDQAFDVLIARFASCVGIAALCWLPFQQVTEFLLRAAVGDFTRFAWSLASIIPRAFATSIVASLVAGELLGERTSVPGAIGRGLLRTPGVVIILTVAVACSAPLVLCCVFPFFAGMWIFSAAPVIFVLEGPGLLSREERAALAGNPLRRPWGYWLQVTRSIARGARLAWGWDAFGRFLVVFLVAEYVLALPLELSGAAFSVPELREFLRANLGLGGGPAQLLIASTSAGFYGLAGAFTVAVMTVYALDLRVRKEGLDLELSLRRLAARSASSAGPSAARRR
jgi:hypothetical protein